VLPNPVDPRGLLTFGVAGVALLVVAWLIRCGGRFPGGLGYLGYVSAVLLLALYLGRLVVLDPASPLIVVPALLSGLTRSTRSSTSGWVLHCCAGKARKGEATMNNALQEEDT
jgi:hypothetical protein